MPGYPPNTNQPSPGYPMNPYPPGMPDYLPATQPPTQPRSQPSSQPPTQPIPKPRQVSYNTGFYFTALLRTSFQFNNNLRKF